MRACDCVFVPRAVLAGDDCIGIAETGSGKTLAFGLPGIVHVRNRGNARSKKPFMLVIGACWVECSSLCFVCRICRIHAKMLQCTTALHLYTSAGYMPRCYNAPQHCTYTHHNQRSSAAALCAVFPCLYFIVLRPCV